MGSSVASSSKAPDQMDVDSELVVVPSDEGTAFETSRRSSRKHPRMVDILTDLGKCLCAHAVTGEEEAKIAVSCRNKKCETVWVSTLFISQMLFT